MNSEPQRETQISIAINRAIQAGSLLHEMIDSLGSKLCEVLGNPQPSPAEAAPQQASSGTSKLCEDIDTISVKLEGDIKSLSNLIDRLEI